MPDQLDDHDLDVLRCINGEDVPGLLWGAAMSVSLEALCGGGYARLVGGRATITDKGRERLEIAND